jgi:Core-2/I-Branching enzyme
VTPAVAFLVVSHTRAAQLARLTGRLLGDSARARVIVHHDPTGEALDRDRLAHPRLSFVPDPAPVRWGDFSQVAMFLRSARHALADGAFDWLVTLSGQDYPLRPVGELEAFLAGTDRDAFIEGAAVAVPPLARRLTGRVDEFAGRYLHRWRAVGPGSRRRAAAALWPRRLRRELPDGRLLVARPRVGLPFDAAFRCYRGADWFTLSRRAVVAGLAAAEARPDLVAHYRATVLPAESFVQTLLHNDPGLDLSHDYARFTRWRPGAAHPEVLTRADLGALRASPAFFARKFDADVDAAVLDALDA